MDERVYWVWLQQVFGAGSSKPAKIHGQYPGGVRTFCQGGPSLWNERRDLTDREAAALRNFTPGQAEARLEYALRSGWNVLTYGCENYPDALRNIPDPPAVLYLKGELPDVDHTLSVAVAGSRKAAPETLETARRFGYQLAVGRACVVSGGAKGVDAAALTGALSFPGARCICVLPVSLESGYVAENARLRKLVVERGGALVTEYFSMDRPEYGAFQVRNRLITGLSRGVVLLQAAAKSGTMIYASRAAEQDRDVFVWPGDDSPAFAGSRSLLNDGARPVLSGEDVLKAYNVSPESFPDGEDETEDLFAGFTSGAVVIPVMEGAPTLREPKPEPPERQKPEQPSPEQHEPDQQPASPFLSPQAEQLLEQLGREPLSVTELEEKTGFAPSVLLGLLTELEVEGLVRSLPGKRYVRGV